MTMTSNDVEIVLLAIAVILIAIGLIVHVLGHR